MLPVAAVDHIAAVTDAQFNALSNDVGLLSGRLDTLSFRLEDVDNRMRGGIAAAMAMGGAPIVPDKNVSMTIAASTYGGEQAFAGSITGRVSESLYISASVSGNTGDSTVGARVAGTIGF